MFYAYIVGEYWGIVLFHLHILPAGFPGFPRWNQGFRHLQQPPGDLAPRVGFNTTMRSWQSKVPQ